MKKVFLFILFLFIPFYIYADTKCDTNKIHIKSIELESKSDNVEEKSEASIDSEGNINLDLTMKEVGDEAKYKILVKNESNEDFELTQNSFSVGSDYFSYSVNSEDKKIKANTEKEVIIDVLYKTEVPSTSFKDGKFSESKDMVLNITGKDNPGIINPPTGGSGIVFLLLMIIIGGVVIYIIVNKKKFVKFFVVLFLLLIIPKVYALCKMDVTIKSNIEILDSIYSNEYKSATIYYVGSNSTPISMEVKCYPLKGEDSCTIEIPETVLNSKGINESTYKGISSTPNTMNNAALTISGGEKYYAFYQSKVEYNFYDESEYTTINIYRSEIFKNDNEMVSILSRNEEATEEVGVPNGPSGSENAGFNHEEQAVVEYETLDDIANSSETTIFNVYKYNVIYRKTENVSEVGKENGYCLFTSSDYVCGVILPTITPSEGYYSVGWSKTEGDLIGTAQGNMFIIEQNNQVVYANTRKANYLNTNTNKYYETIHDAFYDSSNHQTIKVMQDVIEGTTGLAKIGTKFDFNGKKITGTVNYIIDGSHGEVTILGTGTYESTSSEPMLRFLVNNYTGYVEFKNANIVCINCPSIGSGNNAGRFYVDNSRLISENGSCLSTGIISIVGNNSYLKSETGYAISSPFEFRMSSGEVYGISSLNGGTISGGTIKKGIIVNNYATLTMTGGIITDSDIGILNRGNINMSGGTIISSNYGISTNLGTVNIRGNAQITSSNSNAIYLYRGTLNLGNNDSTVSISSPTIVTESSSNQYGVNVSSSGTFNFYDGIIKSASGEGYAINGSIADLPDFYEVKKEVTDGVENAYLVKNPILMEGSSGDEKTNYLRTNIKKQDIESLTFSNSLSGHAVNGTDCWDVSRDQDGKVLAWVTDSDSNGKYEMTIGADGIVYVSSGRSLFHYLTNLNLLSGMNNIDTSNVTNMRSMFNHTGYSSTVFTLDLGDNFDTSKVIDMCAMFANAGESSQSFTLDLGDNFDTSNVTNMASLFSRTGFYSTVFTLNLGNKFDTSNVTNMNEMFLYTGYSSPIFTLNLGDNFNTSNVTDMWGMFQSTGRSSTVLTLDLGDKFDTSKVTNMGHMFNGTGLSSPVFTLNLGDKFNTSNVTSMICLFYGTGKNSRVFTLDLGDKFDTSNVKNMAGMFLDLGYSSPAFTLDLGDKFDTSKVTSMASMFSSTGNANRSFTLNLGDKFDTSNVTNMNHMFRYTGYHSTIFTLDLGDKFNTSNVTDMSNMFDYTGCSSPVFTLNLGDKFDTSNVTNMYYMFYHIGEKNSNFTLDLGDKFNTSKVTNMQKMFYYSEKLKTIYVDSSFDTSSVTNSTDMFKGCTSLVGGANTAYDENHVDATYAHIDGGTSNPGYFTLR